MKTADAKTTFTIKHLSSDYINDIALSLNLDVYGANGDLDDQEIKRRLIEKIHAVTNYEYVESGLMPVWHAADLIRSVWEYENREGMVALTELCNRVAAEPRRVAP